MVVEVDHLHDSQVVGHAGAGSQSDRRHVLGGSRGRHPQLQVSGAATEWVEEVGAKAIPAAARAASHCAEAQGIAVRLTQGEIGSALVGAADDVVRHRRSAKGVCDNP